MEWAIDIKDTGVLVRYAFYRIGMGTNFVIQCFLFDVDVDVDVDDNNEPIY